MRLFFRRLVGIWSYLVPTVAALIGASGIAWATNIPLFSGASISEPSQILATLNTLVTSINFNTPGLVGFSAGPVGSIATTIQQNFVSTTIPTGQLVSAGQAIKATCAGTTNSADVNSKAVFLSIGAATVSSPAMTVIGTNWKLELLFQAATTPVTANYVWIGTGLVGTTTGQSSSLAVNSGNDTTDNLGNNGVTAKCGYVQAASAQDLTMETFTIEQVK